MTTQRPSASEEEYFARQEADLRQVNALETQRQMEQAERERLKALHYLRCPKCGMALETVTLQGVKIDRCFHATEPGSTRGSSSSSRGRSPVSCRRSSASSGVVERRDGYEEPIENASSCLAPCRPS